jgi:hypothetical protein
MTYTILRQIELLPDDLQTVLGSFDLKKEEKHPIVFELAHLTDYTIDRVLSGILKSYVITELQCQCELLTFPTVKKKLGFSTSLTDSEANSNLKSLIAEARVVAMFTLDWPPD